MYSHAMFFIIVTLESLPQNRRDRRTSRVVTRCSSKCRRSTTRPCASCRKCRATPARRSSARTRRTPSWCERATNCSARCARHRCCFESGESLPWQWSRNRENQCDVCNHVFLERNAAKLYSRPSRGIFISTLLFDCHPIHVPSLSSSHCSDPRRPRVLSWSGWR